MSVRFKANITVRAGSQGVAIYPDFAISVHFLKFDEYIFAFVGQRRHKGFLRPTQATAQRSSANSHGACGIKWQADTPVVQQIYSFPGRVGRLPGVVLMDTIQDKFPVVLELVLVLTCADAARLVASRRIRASIALVLMASISG